LATTIPDMTFEIREVLVAGDRVVVRGEVTGTPSGDLFGVPHSGKSFRIMAVDIQTIRDGRIAKPYQPRPITWRTGSPPSASRAPPDHGARWRAVATSPEFLRAKSRAPPLASCGFGR
jgi:hypothetical protein